MEKTNKRFIYVVWENELSTGLNMGLIMIFFGIILMSVLWGGMLYQGLNSILNKAPAQMRNFTLGEFIKSYLYINSLGFAMYFCWMLSFHSFCIEKDLKIIETILATPLDILTFYLGKILAIVTFYLPLYLVIFSLSGLLIHGVSLKYGLSLFSLEIPLLQWIQGFIVAPLLGISLSCIFSMIQLIAKNPRIPTMIFMFFLMVFLMGLNRLQKHLPHGKKTTCIIVGISIALISLSIFIVSRVNRETIICPSGKWIII